MSKKTQPKTPATGTTATTEAGTTDRAAEEAADTLRDSAQFLIGNLMEAAVELTEPTP